jgi:predicted nucleic acid-binding protein
MPGSVLVDSSFLYALNDPGDKYHLKVLGFVQSNRSPRVVPYITLPEVAYLLRRGVGSHVIPGFLDTLDSPLIQLQPLTRHELKRARQIMVKYSDAGFDLVDCCLMALAESLNITQICTFDRRDFSVFKPTHCDYLELLP